MDKNIAITLDRFPKISVIMPVYNGENFLCEAVRSILNQTYSDFEFIIIDDGSTDQTAALLDSYNDPRIVRINHSQNFGLVKSLNDGIAQARGTYIARMDADDVSLPERFAYQLDYLNKNLEIGVLGTGIQSIDSDANVIASPWNPPSNPSFIKWVLLFQNTIAHPTVMIRHEILKKYGGYDTSVVACDYLFFQKISQFTNISNLHMTLLYYRVHVSSISGKEKSLQQEITRQISQKALEELIGHPVFEDDLFGLYNPKSETGRGSVNLILRALHKFIQINELTILERQLIINDAATRIFSIANNSRSDPYFYRFIIKAILMKPSLLSIVFNSIIRRLKLFLTNYSI